MLRLWNPKKRVEKAEATRLEAKKAYLEALDRGDTREMHRRWEVLQSATAEALRAGR